MGGVLPSVPKLFQQAKAAQPAPAPAPVAPTQAEVSQSSATDATGMDSASKKIKRKGRSATILTSSAGVEGDATLGKKSLLGE
jgi:hypothetical protein